MQGVDPRAADYSETGAFGHPALASTAKGQGILDAMIADLASGFVALVPDIRPSR